MWRYLGILSIFAFFALINACTVLDNRCQQHFARCEEIKRQIMFINATNNSMVAAQRSAQLDNLNRAYRENGCV